MEIESFHESENAEQKYFNCDHNRGLFQKSFYVHFQSILSNFLQLSTCFIILILEIEHVKNITIF